MNRTFVTTCHAGRDEDAGLDFCVGRQIAVVDGRITEIDGVFGWSRKDLLEGALMVSGPLAVGDPAPAGWDTWRR